MIAIIPRDNEIKQTSIHIKVNCVLYFECYATLLSVGTSYVCGITKLLDASICFEILIYVYFYIILVFF